MGLYLNLLLRFITIQLILFRASYQQRDYFSTLFKTVKYIAKGILELLKEYKHLMWNKNSLYLILFPNFDAE